MAAALRVLVLLTVSYLSIMVLLYGSRIRGNPLGKPPIPWPALVLAKSSAGVSVLLMIYEAVSGRVDLSLAAAVACACLLIAGAVVFTFAMSDLGANLRVGLADEKTTLVTSGVYGLSRNPIYLAGFCLLGASLIYAFSWVNLAAALIAVALHHRIVLAEEKNLERRFEDYQVYRKRVRRYL